MEEHFRHKVNRRLADKDVDLNKNGKPVIASNINVFCFIITNEMVSICVLHFTKVYCMHKRTKIIKKKCLISNYLLHFSGFTSAVFDFTSAHITY